MTDDDFDKTIGYLDGWQFRWLLASFFYNDELVEKGDNVFEKCLLKHELLDNDFVPHDKWHTIRCVTTGFFLRVCLHSVAEAIEVTDPDGEWRFVFTVRQVIDLLDERERFVPYMTAYKKRFEGDFKKLQQYVSVLKLTMQVDEDDWDFEFPGYVLGTSREWNVI